MNSNHHVVDLFRRKFAEEGAPTRATGKESLLKMFGIKIPEEDFFNSTNTSEQKNKYLQMLKTRYEKHTEKSTKEINDLLNQINKLKADIEKINDKYLRNRSEYFPYFSPHNRNTQQNLEKHAKDVEELKHQIELRENAIKASTQLYEAQRRIYERLEEKLLK